MSIIYTNNRSRKKQPRGKGWQTKVYYKKMKKPEFKPYRPEPSLQSQLAAEHRDKYPSMDSMSAGKGSTAKKEPNVYTGTLIKGIATMHKSNAVPVIDQKQAEEISKMGR